MQDQTVYDPTAAETPAQARRIRSAIFGIFLILLVHLLVFASDFLIPVTAAVLGYFVLNQPRRWLQRAGIPPAASAVLFTFIIVALMIFGMLRLSGPISDFLNRLPMILAEVKLETAKPGGPLEAVNSAAKAADDLLGAGDEETVSVEVVNDEGVARQLAWLAPSLASQIGFALVLLFFLVASGDMFIQKTVQSFRRGKDRRGVLDMAHRIENRLASYLGSITAINIGLGICIGGAMALWNMPTPVAIGALAVLLNFVPFIGALVGATASALLAYGTFDTLWPVFGVWATYMVLSSIEGQIITPILVSQRMKLNTVVVFLCVAFFAWIWSVMGMIVALPILTVVKIISDEVDSLKTLGVFLGRAEEEDAAQETEYIA